MFPGGELAGAAAEFLQSAPGVFERRLLWFIVLVRRPHHYCYSNHKGRLLSKMAKRAVGIDIGATKTRVAVVEDERGVVSDSVFPTPKGVGPRELLDRAAAEYRRLAASGGLEAQAAGIGVAGLVGTGGRLLTAPNLGWRDVDLASLARDVLRMAALVENDVNTACWGERAYGVARGVDDFVCIYVGTGVGGGVVTDGRLLRGPANSAAELGHIVVAAGGSECSCGGRGCLEAYCSGWAIEREARRVAPDATVATPPQVARAARAGEPWALSIVCKVAKHLAAGVATVVHVFNPRLVILGGGVIEGIDGLVEDVRERTRDLLMHSSFSSVEIVKSTLGSEAVVLGAAALASTALP